MEHPIIISKNEVGTREKLITNTIAKAIGSLHGRLALANSMIAPIRRSLDYRGIARRALLVDPLPQGALPIYDTDIDSNLIKFEHNVIVINSKNRIGKREDLYNQTFKIGNIKSRRFNVIDRQVQKARQEIMSQEDDAVFKIFDKIGN